MMRLTIDARDARPLYQQIVDGVKALIARGDLREGMLLPSVRQVASNLGVNLNTVAIAYRQLQEDGLLKVQHGSGAVVSSCRMREQGGKDATTALRTAVVQLVLEGLTDREIVAAVREELQLLRKKGDSR